ncbi:hypothetical protein D3C85_496240 [compost metagenome]
MWARRLVAELRQDAGLDQLLVESGIQAVERAHDLLLEQFIEDAADRQRQWQRLAGQCLAECLGDGAGAEGQRLLQCRLRRGAQVRQALLQWPQQRGAVALAALDQLVQQQVFLVLFVGDERQLVTGAGGRNCALDTAAGKIGCEVAGELLVEVADDRGPLFAYLAHAVEEQYLFAIVGGLVGEGKQGVVHLFEGARQVLVEMVHHLLATRLLELAEAWLDAAAGEGGKIWRWRIAHDGLAGQRPALSEVVHI